VTEASKSWVAVLVIVLAGLLVYSNNYKGEFIWDDYDTIVEHPDIRSLSSIPKLFWSGPDSYNTPLSGRPTVALSFALNYAVNGLDVRGYHLVNNLIHILTGLALFAIIRCTLLLPRFRTRFGAGVNGYALAVAILWLVHPLQTEAVDYITQRTETLMGLFYFLTLFFAAAGFQSARPKGWFAGAVIACGLGMGSKEVMVSAPLLVLLYDRFFVADSFRDALLQRRGFYAALASTWILLFVYQIGSSRSETVAFDLEGLTPLDYLRTQFGVVLHYLRLVFWPKPLVLDYQDWTIVREFSAAAVVPGFILGAMVLSTIWGLRRLAWWAVPGVLFFTVLAPTSSVLPVFTELASERRMYMPLAAVIVLVVFAADAMWRKFSTDIGYERKLLRLAPMVLVLITAAGLGYMTWDRNRDYRTAVGIWTDTVAKRPVNFRAHNNLGVALTRKGRYAEAVGPYQEAVRLKPDYQNAYSNLGAALSILGRDREAIAAHHKALALEPDDAIGHYTLGNAYLRVNDLENATLAFQRAIVLNPELLPAYGNLGLMFMQKGDFDGAEQYFQTMLKLAPERTEPYVVLAELRTAQGRTDEAVQLYRQALQLAPGSQDIAERLKSLQADGSQTQ